MRNKIFKASNHDCLKSCLHNDKKNLKISYLPQIPYSLIGCSITYDFTLQVLPFSFNNVLEVENSNQHLVVYPSEKYAHLQLEALSYKFLLTV